MGCGAGCGSTVPRLSRFAVEHLLLLPLGALIAMVWVNTAPESYYRFSFTIAFAVNEIAMAFFFALMTKEVVEATAPGGVLHSWRRAMLPVIAAVAATAVPALIYGRVVEALDEPMLVLAWPVAMATDLAIGYFVLRLIFRSHPVIPFFLLLGIGADALGFLALAFLNPTRRRGPGDWRGDACRRGPPRGRAAVVARRQFLAIPDWPRRGRLARVFLERAPPGALARADHAVPAACESATRGSSSMRAPTRRIR